MKVKIKRLHEDAVIPQYAKAGDAGLDLTAVEDATVKNNTATYKTGLAVEIPEGHVGLIIPRSSIYKTGNRQSNCVGVIDSGYRGELLVKHDVSTGVLAALIDNDTETYAALNPYKKGDRIAQLIIIPYPQIELEEVMELSDSSRGEGGFGSTGA